MADNYSYLIKMRVMNGTIGHITYYSDRRDVVKFDPDSRHAKIFATQEDAEYAISVLEKQMGKNANRTFMVERVNSR